MITIHLRLERLFKPRHRETNQKHHDDSERHYPVKELTNRTIGIRSITKHSLALHGLFNDKPILTAISLHGNA